MDIKLEKIYSGKVRDIFKIDETKILMVASDRLSAFDVVLNEPIEGKGEILTAISNKWFEFFKDIVPNHLTHDSVYDILPEETAKQIENRAVIVKKLTPIKCEAIVRGYLVGSGWKEYQQKGSISGILLPKHLSLAEKLPEVIFTPSTKAKEGEHDENITLDKSISILGKDIALKVKELSINLYKQAQVFAKKRGIIIADTKFEFGLDENGVVTLMDEVLTPDSSRFWSVEDYHLGINPPSFDKQFIRDWLERTQWNKKPPAPHIPKEIIDKTIEKYRTILSKFFPQKK